MEKTKPGVCSDNQGVLPPCAPLAVPYVPFQQTCAKQYSISDALNNGTLFPGLNLPFHAKVNAANVVNNPLAELQALEFVVLELGLYLNTHPDDGEAFCLYQQFVALEKEAREVYVAQYGPLFQTDSAKDKTYTWLKDPWPWNITEGGK